MTPNHNVNVKIMFYMNPFLLKAHSFFHVLCFQDNNYTAPLVIPPLGLELRTSIYVQVQAVNLTNQ